MSKWVHYTLQGLAIVVQIGDASSGIVPPHYKVLLSAVVGLAQAILHQYATAHTPSGKVIPPGA